MHKMVSRDACRACGAKRVNCCCNDDYYLALTINDIKRIISRGFKTEEVIEGAGFEENELEDEQWWKEAMIKIKNKLYRISLIQKEGSGCVFLRKQEGCVLGNDRPVLCKIFPFWIKHNRIEYYDDFCDIVKQKIPLRDALDTMNETEKDIRDYFAEIEKDFLENRAMHERLTHLLLQKRYGEFEKAVAAADKEIK